jgi:hypothetical protein
MLFLESGNFSTLHKLGTLSIFFIHAQSEICHRDIEEAQAAYEDLHVNISADSYDKLDAAVALIDLLDLPFPAVGHHRSHLTHIPCKYVL